MQDSITHEALEALSKKAQEPGALIADKGAFLVALETAYRTGQLILAQPSGDEVEAVWEALKARCCADPANAKKCVMVSKDDFTAAITAYEAASGVAKMREALKAVNDAETPSSWEAAVDGLIEAARAALGEKP